MRVSQKESERASVKKAFLGTLGREKGGFFQGMHALVVWRLCLFRFVQQHDQICPFLQEPHAFLSRGIACLAVVDLQEVQRLQQGQVPLQRLVRQVRDVHHPCLCLRLPAEAKYLRHDFWTDSPQRQRLRFDSGIFHHFNLKLPLLKMCDCGSTATIDSENNIWAHVCS